MSHALVNSYACVCSFTNQQYCCYCTVLLLYCCNISIETYFVILQSLEETHTDDHMLFDHKFVRDKIDKNVKRSFERHEHRGQSLHYVHGYAVKCRISRSGLSNKPPNNDTPDTKLMIPSVSDVKALKNDCITLVSR